MLFDIHSYANNNNINNSNNNQNDCNNNNSNSYDQFENKLQDLLTSHHSASML